MKVPGTRTNLTERILDASVPFWIKYGIWPISLALTWNGLLIFRETNGLARLGGFFGTVVTSMALTIWIVQPRRKS